MRNTMKNKMKSMMKKIVDNLTRFYMNLFKMIFRFFKAKDHDGKKPFGPTAVLILLPFIIGGRRNMSNIIKSAMEGARHVSIDDLDDFDYEGVEVTREEIPEEEVPEEFRRRAEILEILS